MRTVRDIQRLIGYAACAGSGHTGELTMSMAQSHHLRNPYADNSEASSHGEDGFSGRAGKGFRAVVCC